MRFYDGLNFKKKLRKFVWKKLLESNALNSSNNFHRCTLNFPKVQTDVRIRQYNLGHVHTYPEICENANFFLRIRLASTRIQRILRPYPEIFENALQSGNFFIRYEYVLRIRLRHSLGSSLHAEHYKQTWRTARL